MSNFLIFDFDGTIVDSKQVYYHSMEKNLAHLGLHKRAIDNLIDKGLSISESLKNVGLSWFVRFYMKRKIMKDVLDKANIIKKCKDVDSIRKIKARKILISNSLSEFIYPILKHLRIMDEFDEIYGAEDFTDKTDFIKNYIIKNKIKKEQVIYIGDRVADVKLAKKIGCKSVIVTGKCAWNSKKDVMKAKPDYVLDDIKDVSRLIEK